MYLCIHYYVLGNNCVGSIDSKDMTKRAQRKAERVIFSYFSKYSKVQNDVDLKQLDSLLKIS